VTQGGNKSVTLVEYGEVMW